MWHNSWSFKFEYIFGLLLLKLLQFSKLCDNYGTLLYSITTVTTTTPFFTTIIYYTLYICSINICTYVPAMLLPGVLAITWCPQGDMAICIVAWRFPRWSCYHIGTWSSPRTWRTLPANFYCLKVIIYWWLSHYRVEVFKVKLLSL